MPHVLPQAFELVALEKLKPHPRNARVHSNATLDQSIAENGVYKPVVASRASGYILAGHGLAERAQAAGIAEIPVVWLDGLSPAQELKIIAADNRTSDLGGYDETALAELLTSIRDETGGFEGTGYDQEQLDKLIDTAAQTILDDAKQRAATLRRTPAEEPEESAAPQLSAGLEYRVVVDCQNELQQTELLQRFETEGLTCRALIS